MNGWNDEVQDVKFAANVAVLRQGNHDAKTEGFRGLETSGFDSMTPRETEHESSLSAFPTPIPDEFDLAGARVRDRDADGDRDVTLLRDALQCDDRQVLAPRSVLDAEADRSARPSSNEPTRRGT